MCRPGCTQPARPWDYPAFTTPLAQRNRSGQREERELQFSWVCCDFRPLNEVTVKDAYPLPRIDESLARLGKSKIFTSIYLAWVFWQILVSKTDRQKNAFACKLRLFEWRRMPFGMCNASATFQRAIARALRKNINWEGSMVMAYIDDIVIATEIVEDHMVRLREVFECLCEAGFKMRDAKCDFMKSEITFLGRVVSAEGVKPNPKAVAKLRGWQIPRNKTEMQSFMGFANFYREFIPWHGMLVSPLHSMKVDNQALSWLKTYSNDQALIGRWRMTIKKNHFPVGNHPRTQHRNADGLSKRTKDYRWR